VCTRVLAREPISNHVEPRKASGPLDLEEQEEAIESANRRLDALSIRAVQTILARPATGTIAPEDVQAIAWLAPAPRSGMLKGAALDALVHEAAQRGMQDEAIHVVARLSKLDIDAAVSVRYDPGTTQTNSNAGFEGPLKFIVIGPGAFASATKLREAIAAMVDMADPKTGAQVPLFARRLPRLLTDFQAADAVAFNQRKLRDPRAILALQYDVGAVYTERHDHQTVQYIADSQLRMSIAPTGELDRETFNAVFGRRAAAGDGNAAIRLAVDYLRLDSGAVLDVAFDSSLTEVCQSRSAGTGTPVTLTFGPPLFASGVDFAVRKIADFYAQAHAKVQRGHP
jgi:hypothetical protein